MSRLAILWFVALVIVTAIVSQTKKPDTGYYYRVKVALSHKGTPIDIDVVVGCHARGMHHADGSGSSVDLFGTGPIRYAMQIPGNHAIEIDTGEGGGDSRITYCAGETTENGKVAKDWLPFVVWYENGEDLSFGIGYQTRDAYENPNSQLEFHGATVSTANADDFAEFATRRPPNLIPPETRDFMTSGPPPLPSDLSEFVREPWRSWWYSGQGNCHGVLRHRLTPAQQQIVRSLWPEGRPRFWTVAPENQEQLYQQLFPRSEKSPPIELIYRGRRYDAPVPKITEVQNPGGTNKRIVDNNYRPEIFPMATDAGLRSLSRDSYSNGGYHYDIRIGDGHSERGFVYCERGPMLKLQQAIQGSGAILQTPFWPERNPVCSINANTLLPQRMAGAPDSRTCWGEMDHSMAFENDDYIIIGLIDKIF